MADGRLVFLVLPGTPIIECPKGCRARVCLVRGAVGHFAVEMEAGAGCPTNELYAPKHGACVTMYYILENGVPVAKTDVKAWMEWWDNNLELRQIASDEVNNSTVSTCFLGINLLLRRLFELGDRLCDATTGAPMPMRPFQI